MVDRYTLFFLLLLVAGLLCHGGVHDWYVFASFAAVFVACCALRGIPRVLFLICAGLLALALLQLVPMPLFVQATFSPVLYDARTCIGVEEGFYPLSVEPGRAFIGWLKLFTVLGVACVSAHYFKGRNRSRPLETSSAYYKERGRRDFFRLFFILAFIESYYALTAYFFGFDSFLVFGERIFKDFTTGSFVNKNHFGLFVAAGIPCGIYLCLASYRSIRKRFLIDKAAHGMIIYGLMTFSLLVALVLSRSRGAIVSLIAGLVLFAVLLRKRDKIRVLLACAGLVVIAGGILVWIEDPGVVERFYASEAGFSESRLNLWKRSSRLLSDYILIGTGPGSFRTAFERHNDSGELLTEYRHPHNEYLAFVIDFGLPVGGAVVFLLFLLLLSSVKDAYGRESVFAKVPISIFAVFLVNFLIDFNLRIPVNGILFGIVCGFLVSKIGKKAITGRIIPLSAMIVFIIGTVSFLSLPKHYGADYMEMDPGLSPLNYKVLVWRALMLRGAQDYDGAKRYLDCASDAAPFNPDVYFHRAITYHDAGGPPAALQEIVDSASGIAMPCDRMVSLFGGLPHLSDKELFDIYDRLRPGCTREVVRFCLENGREDMLIGIIEQERDRILDDPSVRDTVIELLEKNNSYLALMLLMDYAVTTRNDDRFIALLAKAHLRLGNWRSAEALLKEGAGQRQSLQLYLGLAELYRALGSRKELVRTLQGAQARFPNSPDIARGLGDAYRISGLYSESLEAYATYLHLTEDRSVAPHVKELLKKEEVRKKTTIPNIIYKVFADDREVMELLSSRN